MTDRLPCNVPGCPRTILPDTAARTAGRCMPCTQSQAAEEQRRYIEANQVDVDRFAGVTDPVELIRLAHQTPVREPLKRYLPPPKTLAEMYRELRPEDTRRLIALTARLVGEGQDEARDMASTLACVTQADLEDVQLALVRKRVPYPAVVFRAASERVTASLAALLHEPKRETLLISHVLEALAWTRHPHAIGLFMRWRDAPPDWAGLLHLEPCRYAACGGWELGVDAKPRALCGEPCGEFVASHEAASADARAIVATTSRCRCGRALALLFDVRAARTLLPWLEWPYDRLVVPMCDACVCFETLFYSVTESADFSEVSERKAAPADAATWPELPSAGLVVGARRSPLHAADWLLEMGESQLGGHPGWVQDLAYPTCPTCSRTMSFVGQVAHAEFEAHAEGTYYGFACPRCRVVAANYQQT